MAPEKKRASVTLTEEYGSGICNSIGYFRLDDEDIVYLLKKYRNSEIVNKEIELNSTIEKLNKLKVELEELKQNNNE